MTELKNVEVEQSRFRLRLTAAAIFVVLGFLVLGARLVYLQVMRHDDLSAQAESNRIAVSPIVPTRGIITDRNGVVLANNYSAYTLEITPSKVVDLEATIAGLSELVEIQPRDRKRFKRLLDESKSSSRCRSGPSSATKRWPDSPCSDSASRGWMSRRVCSANIPWGRWPATCWATSGASTRPRRTASTNRKTRPTTAERSTLASSAWSKVTRPNCTVSPAWKRLKRALGARPVRRLRSRPATPGNSLELSIDIRLQALVEDMFGERRGALVALDPRNGEVLAFVSKPTFDPNLFVDGIDVESWRELNESIDKPLLNRALRGTYPPGSTYKPFLAMAALNSGKRDPNQIIQDNATFQFGNHTFRSHGDAGLGPVDMVRSIVKSSNVYYYSLANEMGVDLMHDELEPFAFGRKTGIDIEGEVTGLLPSTAWKRRAYKSPEQQKWYAGETISLGIGQGYNNFSMLQLASATATLASGGLRFKPHLVREVEDVLTRERRHLVGRCVDAVAPQARARGLDPPCALRCDAGGHFGALVRRRAVQERRQDGHRTSCRHQGQ